MPSHPVRRDQHWSGWQESHDEEQGDAGLHGSNERDATRCQGEYTRVLCAVRVDYESECSWSTRSCASCSLASTASLRLAWDGMSSLLSRPCVRVLGGWWWVKNKRWIERASPHGWGKAGHVREARRSDQAGSGVAAGAIEGQGESWPRHDSGRLRVADVRGGPQATMLTSQNSIERAIRRVQTLGGGEGRNSDCVQYLQRGRPLVICASLRGLVHVTRTRPWCEDEYGHFQGSSGRGRRLPAGHPSAGQPCRRCWHS